MNKKLKHGTTTLTLRIPTEMKSFFDELAENGYNRSFLMLKMAKVLRELYVERGNYPGGLHKSAEKLLQKAKRGELLDDLPKD